MKTGPVIHLFAALHALLVIICTLCGLEDSIGLTMLTMLMTILICMKGGTRPEITAATVVIANIAGFVLGTYGARLVGLMFSSGMIVHTISTFCTTEILGWAAYLATRKYNTSGDLGIDKGNRWLILAFLVIIVVRFLYLEIFRLGYTTRQEFAAALYGTFSNASALMLLICANIVAIKLDSHWIRKALEKNRFALPTAFVLGTSVLLALFVGFGLPLKFNRDFGMHDFWALLMIMLVLEAFALSVTYMINYAVQTAKARDEAVSKKHIAQYQYMKLKEQMNPHFLFNSLNVLDCLVQEQRTEDASDYIHKLAGLYRYMIQSESETLVPLRDELVFVEMYADLMKVRFDNGFDISREIDGDCLDRLVAPCCIQLLIENALKHNTVSAECPLHIRIAASGDRICVSNDLRVKQIAPKESTGLGLKYIQKIYGDLTAKPVDVRSTKTEYKISIPLI